MGLNRRLLHLVDVIGMLENVVSLGKALLDIARFGMNVMDDVALPVMDFVGVFFVVDDGRARFHSLVLVENGRQHLIIHFDQFERGGGDFWRLGGHGRYPIAHIAHLVIKTDLIPRWWIGVTLPAGGIFDAGHILVMDDGMNAG